MNAEQEDKLKARIQKLLALASSPNPHEAALAAGQAAKLIAQHQLDRAQLFAANEVDETIDLWKEDPLDASKRLRGWKIALASVLAEINHCRILVSGPVSGQRHHAKDKLRKIWLVGRCFDIQRVFSMYPSFVRMVEQVSMQKLHGADHRFREDFRRGVVASLAKSMRDSKVQWQSLVESDEPQTRALMARVQDRGEAVEHWMRQKLGVSMGKQKALRVILAAYRAGQEAGAEVSPELLANFSGQDGAAS